MGEESDAEADKRRLDWLAAKLRDDDLRLDYWLTGMNGLAEEPVFAISPTRRVAWIQALTLRGAIDEAMAAERRFTEIARGVLHEGL
jgi:hypothetical protein